MAYLALVLLGLFQSTLDGLPVVGLNFARLRTLLAYLAVERGREHPRERLASLLWPERPGRKALNLLRSALPNLHRALPSCLPPAPVCGSTPPATTGWMGPSLGAWPGKVL